MNLFDGQIKNITNELEKFDVTNIQYNSKKIATVTKKSGLVLTRDAICELGGGFNPCVGMTIVTSDIHFENSISIYGKELSDIKKDCPFAKIVLLEIKDELGDDQEQFNAIKELEFLKYKLFIDGFMARASAMNCREQVRVSKKAVQEGLSFESIGNTIISEYLKNPIVKNVKVIFSTLENMDYTYLTNVAKKVSDITSALNHILDNVNFDCKTCNLKTICDEVEGMRELHMKRSK